MTHNGATWKLLSKQIFQFAQAYFHILLVCREKFFMFEDNDLCTYTHIYTISLSLQSIQTEVDPETFERGALPRRLILMYSMQALKEH